MDANQFYSSLQTDDEKRDDFFAGMEHFVRLKKQAGIQKVAFVTEPSDRPVTSKKDATLEKCPGCGFEKDACSCKAKMASTLGDAYRGFKSGLKFEQIGAGTALKGLKAPGIRAHSAGRLVGHAAPALAAGAIGHTIGSHGKEKEAAEFDELQGNQEMHPYEERMGKALAGVKDKLERNEKTASLREAIKNIDPALIGPVAGGTALGGLLTYLGSRPHDDLKGRSKTEHQLEKAVNNEEEENGLMDKLHNRTTEMGHGYAKAFREHPGKASLIGAGMGAAAGYGIGRLAGARPLLGALK
jgi:hypothetical protein